MIGRASIGYPWIFNEIKHFFETGEHLAPPTVAERIAVTREHLDMSIKWKGEKLGIIEMKRHYANYFKGLPHFKDLRIKLVTSFDYNEIVDTLDQVAEKFSNYEFA